MSDDGVDATPVVGGLEHADASEHVDEFDAPSFRRNSIDLQSGAPVDDGAAGSDFDPVCDPDGIARKGTVIAMYPVVDAELRAPCAIDSSGGTVDDSRLRAVWQTLSTISPAEVLDDIDLLVGYDRCADCDTLAFVQMLDEQATVVALAVDVSKVDRDPDGLRVTLVHELAHVLTQRPGRQLNPSASSAACHTHHNGVGCLAGDSYLWAWIREFWTPEMLVALPDDGSGAGPQHASVLCSVNGAFTGTYAATRPDEDFAETFAAFVLDIDVAPSLSDKLAFFDRYPELVEMRANARSAGLSLTDLSTAGDEFDGCDIENPVVVDPSGA